MYFHEADIDEFHATSPSIGTTVPAKRTQSRKDRFGWVGALKVDKERLTLSCASTAALGYFPSVSKEASFHEPGFPGTTHHSVCGLRWNEKQVPW
jgi:hypothetical protein